MKYAKSQQSGFSLVETLVAITILLVVIVGPMKISSKASNSSSFSNEQVVAFFLAQEGAEIAQKARDDAIIKSFLPTGHTDYDADPWATFIREVSNPRPFRWCYAADGCGLELNTDDDGTLKPVERCNGAGSCRLYYDSSNERARYTHEPAGNTQTPYTRIVYFETMPGDQQVKVTSRVYWRSGSIKDLQEVEVVTYLFNVYGRP